MRGDKGIGRGKQRICGAGGSIESNIGSISAKLPGFERGRDRFFIDKAAAGRVDDNNAPSLQPCVLSLMILSVSGVSGQCRK